MQEQNNYQIVALEFAAAKQPDFTKNRGERWVRFNAEDDYPEYLIYLLNYSPKHNAIINNKCNYIFGGGLKIDETDQAAVLFKKANSRIIKRIILDLRAFGMSYLQVIPTKGGGYKFSNLSYENVRSNETNSRFWWKKDWKMRWEEAKEMPAFGRNLKEASVLCFKEIRPGKSTYGLPDFISCTNYIEADIEVSKHCLNNAKAGFTPTKFINFYNGEPTNEKKKEIEGKFGLKFTGSEGKKIILAYNNDPAKKPTVDDLGTSDLTKEDFTAVDQMIATNIYAGHQVTNPALFGVPNPNHALGGNSGAELRLAFELFKNTYANNKRDEAIEIVNFLAGLQGVTTKIDLIEVEPIGMEISSELLMKVAPRSWVLEKLGIDTKKYTDAPAESGGSPTPAPGAMPVAEQQMVNEHLKNLTGKQQQQLERIIRKYKKGQLERGTAELLLKNAFGFGPQDIAVMLGKEQFSEEDAFSGDEDVAMLFEAFGEAADNFKCYNKKVVGFEQFAEEITDPEDKMKVYIEANPKATPEKIAKDLNIDIEVVKEYLDGVSGGSTPKKPLNIPKFEIRYSYEKRPEAEGPSVLPTTRPFCKKMVALNRLYTRKEIQQISAFLGYDVMLRSGGFWNNNGKTEIHCRHEFFSQIVIRKK